MFPCILCPVDLSDHSRVTLRYAAYLAGHFGAELTVLAVNDPLLAQAASMSFDGDAFLKESVSELEAFVRDAAPGAPLRTPPRLAVRTGEPAAEILAAARETHADLIVMGTHGHGGYRRLVLGSIAAQVLRDTAAPVLIVPPAAVGEAVPETGSPFAAIRLVMAPVDFGPRTERDARIAAGAARAFGVPLLLLHIVPPIEGVSRWRPRIDELQQERMAEARRQIEDLARRLPQDVSIEVDVGTGKPGDEIAAIAGGRHVGLIVMGLRGAGETPGAKTGTIAYRVLQHAPAVLLALPPQLHGAIAAREA